MKRIHEIINEVKALRGTNVEVFSHSTTLPKEYSKYIIDTINILNVLEDFEAPEIVDYWTFKEVNGEDVEVLNEITFEEYLKILEEEGLLVEKNSDNTYNWFAPVSNDFYYHIYKNSKDDNLIIKFAIHKYGDIRENYTEEFCIVIDNEEKFFDILREGDKFNTVEINGEKYYIDTRIFYNMLIVSIEDGTCIGEIYAEDDEEAIREIKELINAE